MFDYLPQDTCNNLMRMFVDILFKDNNKIYNKGLKHFNANRNCF